MKKYTIHLSYFTEGQNESKLNSLGATFEHMFKETFPDASLSSFFCAQEIVPPEQEEKMKESKLRAWEKVIAVGKRCIK